MEGESIDDAEKRSLNRAVREICFKYEFDSTSDDIANVCLILPWMTFK